MKYCVPYRSSFRFMRYVDEIILDYSEYPDIVDFVASSNFSQEQMLIIDIRRSTASLEDILPMLHKLWDIHPLFKVKCFSSQHEAMWDSGLCYFFSEYCYTKDEVYSFIERGVTDIYIVADLAFNLKEIAESPLLDNIVIRVIPNIAQYTEKCKEVPDILRFFVRPEDTDVYDKYVDVFEILAPGDKLSVLFEIYKNKRWLGNLGDIISGIDEEIPNNGIVAKFGEQRVNCGHKCMLNNCGVCNLTKEASKLLEKVSLGIVREKDGDWKRNEYKTDEKTVLNG